MKLCLWSCYLFLLILHMVMFYSLYNIYYILCFVNWSYSRNNIALSSSFSVDKKWSTYVLVTVGGCKFTENDVNDGVISLCKCLLPYRLLLSTLIVCNAFQSEEKEDLDYYCWYYCFTSNDECFTFCWFIYAMFYIFLSSFIYFLLRYNNGKAYAKYYDTRSFINLMSPIADVGMSIYYAELHVCIIFFKSMCLFVWLLQFT